MIGFIVGSAEFSVFIEKTVVLLIVAGTINGLVLPLALGIHSAGRSQKNVVGAVDHHPLWLAGAEWGVAAFTLWTGAK
ncbi:hypothetical protein NL360_28075, partial [Klebsiella pneumoniae]|nr:hypothetical protein [Klebsiella pneumoniae]